MNIAPTTPVNMKNLKFQFVNLNQYLLVPAIVLALVFLAPDAHAAFVPEGKQGSSKKTFGSAARLETYSFIAGFTNKEIEILAGRKLTIREKLGLNMLRRQNKANVAGTGDKCFTMYLKNGDVLEVNLIQISTNEIKYKRCNKPDDPEIVISKEDVFSIKDGSGEAIYSSKNETWKKDYAAVDGGTDRLALAAGITGIFAVTFGILFWPAGLAAGLAAGIMGIVSLSRFKTNQKLRGEGWAITGIVAGGLWVFFGILVLIALASGW